MSPYPPPPSPPPASPPPGAWGAPSGGPDPAGPPPPPWRRRRRRWLWAAAAVVVVLLVVAVARWGGSVGARLADDIDLGADAGPGRDAPTEPTPPGEPAPPGDAELEAPDPDALDGTDAAAAQLLIDVDRAEREMMRTQDRLAEVLAGAGGGGADEAVEELATIAGDGQRALQEVRRDLAASVDDAGIRTVRDRYLAHLDAWVRYLVAVEDDPRLLRGGAEHEAFLLAIDTTGQAFARSIREDLPGGLDEEVRSFADAIVARGFPDRPPRGSDTV